MTALSRDDLRILSGVLSNAKMQNCTALDISGKILNGIIGMSLGEIGLSLWKS